MYSVTTEHIWTIKADGLVTRRGDVRLDENGLRNGDRTMWGPLRVTSGLLMSDLVIFLGFSGDVDDQQELQETSVGYLVTTVNSDPSGSGTLVAGDLVESDPEKWFNGRILEAWGSLDLEEYSPREFGLGFLAVYLESQLGTE